METSQSGPAALLDRARRFLEVDLWTWEPKPRTWAAWAVRPLQLAVLIGEGFIRDQLLLRASALTYVTLLAMIPLLALTFAIVGAIGVGEDLEGLFHDQLVVVSPQIAEKLLEVLAGVKLGQLGTIGAATLLVTTVLAIGNVEKALNDIWGVREQRDYVRRFTDYLAVLVTAPLMLAVAMSAATAFRSQTLVQQLLTNPMFETLWSIGITWVPTAVFALAFAFLYRFLPNTHVNLTSAALGGIVAAILFTFAQGAYWGFNVGAARYNALVGGMAYLPIFFVFVYLSWAIMLVGAELAFAHQNLDHYRREVLGTPPGPAAREAMGLEVALELARSFRDGGPVWNADGLAERLDVPVRTVRDVCSALVAAGIAAPYGNERDGGYQLGRAAETVRVGDVLTALRGERDVHLPDEQVGRAAEEVLGRLEQGAAEAAGNDTLAAVLARVAATDVEGARTRS